MGNKDFRQLTSDPDNDLAQAETSVAAYISARYRWEQLAWSTWQSNELSGSEDDSSIRDGYDELLRTHCARRIQSLGLRYSFGDPPTVDPATTQFMGARRRANEIVVKTEESSDVLGRDTVKYVLIHEDGRLTISDRQVRTRSGAWIREVL